MTTKTATKKPAAISPSVAIGAGFQAEVETITPEIATQILENANNIKNRSVRPIVVMRYARDMRDGVWRLTGDSIKLDEQGNLLDGQHRLWAVIESGVTIQSIVVRGVQPEAFSFMDIGAKRLPSDLLSMAGFTNTRHLGAATTMLMEYERTRIFRRPHQADRPRGDEVVQYVQDRPGLVEWMKEVRNARNVRNLGITDSLLGAMMFVFEQHDANLSEEFLDALNTGAELYQGHPILALRDLLTRRMVQGQSSQEYEQISALVIKAWNACREGRDIKSLRYLPSETYPTIA